MRSELHNQVFDKPKRFIFGHKVGGYIKSDIKSFHSVSDAFRYGLHTWSDELIVITLINHRAGNELVYVRDSHELTYMHNAHINMLNRDVGSWDYSNPSRRKHRIIRRYNSGVLIDVK